MEDRSLSACNLGILETLSDEAVQEIVESYNGFCAAAETLLNGAGDFSLGSEFVADVHSLCKHGLVSLVRDHFLRALEVRNFTAFHFLIIFLEKADYSFFLFPFFYHFVNQDFLLFNLLRNIFLYDRKHLRKMEHSNFGGILKLIAIFPKYVKHNM